MEDNIEAFTLVWQNGRMTSPKLGKRDKLAADLATYLRQVGRKAQKGQEPNDRRHDRELERRLKQMSPLEVDELTRADGD